MLLTDKEKAAAVNDVAELISASGLTATVQRISSGERLYGSDDETYSDVAAIPVELNETPPVELSGKIDALAYVLMDADIRCEDRFKVGEVVYKIQTIEEERFFGVVTHKSLQLVKLHGR